MLVVAAAPVVGCSEKAQLPVEAGMGPNPTLPAPTQVADPDRRRSRRRWAGPTAQRRSPPPASTVHAFATGLDHPRWLYVLPNGDVLVAETNAPPRPEDGKGIKGWFMKLLHEEGGRRRCRAPTASRCCATPTATASPRRARRSSRACNSPFGMALVGDDLYVANTDAVVRFPYRDGRDAHHGAGTKVADLPGGPLNHHWTKNLIASRDGSQALRHRRLEQQRRRERHGRGRRAAPRSGRSIATTGAQAPLRVRAAQPERPRLGAGDRRAVDGGQRARRARQRPRARLPDLGAATARFYGWPYSYFGQHVDERVKPPRPDLVAKAIMPDYALGSHVAPLGLAFSDGSALPARFASGAFVGQHGSWNRKPPQRLQRSSSCRSRTASRPGTPVDVLTGFLERRRRGATAARSAWRSTARGALLVADDVGNAIWRVTRRRARRRRCRE